MRLTFDVDELFGDLDSWEHDTAEAIKDETRAVVRASVRRLVQETFEAEGEALREHICTTVRIAIALASEEVEAMEQEELLRQVL